MFIKKKQQKIVFVFFFLITFKFVNPLTQNLVHTFFEREKLRRLPPQKWKPKDLFKIYRLLTIFTKEKPKKKFFSLKNFYIYKSIDSKLCTNLLSVKNWVNCLHKNENRRIRNISPLKNIHEIKTYKKIVNFDIYEPIDAKPYVYLLYLKRFHNSRSSEKISPDEVS